MWNRLWPKSATAPARRRTNSAGRPRARPGQPLLPPGDSKSGGPKRRGVLFGLLGAAAVVVAGATGYELLQPSTPAGGGFGFTIVTDPQQVTEYLHQQHLPPEKAQQLEEQAKKQELVVWHVTQLPGWTRQEGQKYTMDNGTDHYQFTINSGGQDFGLFAEKSATAFTFSADSNPGDEKMTGVWSTPAGRTPFDMQVGQTMTVRVK